MSYENKPVKRYAQSLAFRHHSGITTIVALGGDCANDAVNTYAKVGARNITLVEHDETRAKLLEKQVRAMPWQNGMKTRVKKGDFLNFLPRRKADTVIDIDCEKSIKSELVKRLIDPSVIGGRNWVLTLGFRCGLTMHQIANEFCATLGTKRTKQLMPTIGEHLCLNHAGTWAHVNEYTFSSVAGNTYSLITYKDGKNGSLMVIITPINK
jgi:hypothetical protein